MSQVTESILFRQKLYQNFKESGLLSKLKTTLRTSLLQKLQKPISEPNFKHKQQQQNLPFQLKQKFLQSIVVEYLRNLNREYTLSIFMAECNLEEQDCLRYNQLSEITNLNKPSGDKSFLFKLVEQYTNIRCNNIQQRSTQTDFDQPLSKKLSLIDKEYTKKIDYWKLIPNTNISNIPDTLYEHEQKLKAKFNLQKQQIKKQMQISIKNEMERKFENQYLFRMKQVQKQHEARLTELKNRQKAILDGLQRKKKDLQQKSKQISQDEFKMINKYELKLKQLEAQYRLKLKDLENKQKEFWKKELELKAKKREYEQTIRLVKQKVIAESIE